MSIVGLIWGHGGCRCRRPPGGRPSLSAAVPSLPGGEPAVGGGAALPLKGAVLQVMLRGLPRGRGEVVGRHLKNTIQWHGYQMAIAWSLDCMCLALWASGLWLRYATLQNLIPSFPWIAPPCSPPWCNPRKGRHQILQSGNLVQWEL